MGRLPPTEKGRVVALSPLVPPRIGGNYERFVGGMNSFIMASLGNSSFWKEICLPSSNGFFSARSLACMYGAWANGGAVLRGAPEGHSSSFQENRYSGTKIDSTVVLSESCAEMSNAAGSFGCGAAPPTARPTAEGFWRMLSPEGVRSVGTRIADDGRLLPAAPSRFAAKGLSGSVRHI